MRTTLDAVNEILEGIGEPPVTAVDTGGTSDAGRAETTLDREGRKIQMMGWYNNEENDVELLVSTDKILVPGAVTNGPYVNGETITQETSGATGTFQALVTEATVVAMYLVNLTGTFTVGPKELTGGTSGATAGGTTRTATDRIVLDASWLQVLPHEVRGVLSEDAKFVKRNLLLYDVENNTYAWTSSVQVDRVVLQTFTELPEQLANYIIKEAAVKFQVTEKRGRLDDAIAGRELLRARVEARQWDSDLRRVDMLETPGVRRVKGNRNRYIESIGE